MLLATFTNWLRRRAGDGPHVWSEANRRLQLTRRNSPREASLRITWSASPPIAASLPQR